MDSTFEKYYDSLTKEDLILILRYFDLDVPKGGRKRDLVRSVAEFMGYHPADWMMRLTERDLYLLKDLVVAGPGGCIEYEMDEFPSVLERLMIVTVDEDDPDRLTMSLNEDFRFPVSAIIGHVINDKEMDGTLLCDRLALGLMNTYGILSASDFVEVAHDLLKGEPDCDELLAGVVASEYIAFQRMEIDGEVYLCSPFALDCEKLLADRKKFKKYRKFKLRSIEEIELAGAGVPYCCFGHGSPEHDALKMVLERLGYDEIGVDDVINEIWQASQYSTDEHYAGVMFDSVNDCIDEFDGFEEYKAAVDAVAAYANSVPKWVLRGRTSDEADSLKISIRVEENQFPARESYGPRMPEQTNVTIDSPLNEFYKYNMAVKHVAPDDPCPCGSGLSYCRCHGKNLS